MKQITAVMAMVLMTILKTVLRSQSSSLGGKSAVRRGRGRSGAAVCAAPLRSVGHYAQKRQDLVLHASAVRGGRKMLV